MITKPDSVTLFVTRLMASVAWSYDNRLLGMYFRLLCGLVRSERLGYLPNDVAELMKIARGNDRFFEADWRTLGRRFRQTQDGLWIYHETMLEALQPIQPKGVEQGNKVYPKVRDIDSKEILSLELQPLFLEAYESYPRRKARERAEKAFKKACKKFARRLGNGTGELGAAKRIVELAKLYAPTQEGREKRFIPYMASWINSGEMLDAIEEWESWRGKAETKAERERRAIDEVFSR